MFQNNSSRWWPFSTTHRSRRRKENSDFSTVIKYDPSIWWPDLLVQKNPIGRDRNTEITWLAELPAPRNLMDDRWIAKTSVWPLVFFWTLWQTHKLIYVFFIWPSLQSRELSIYINTSTLHLFIIRGLVQQHKQQSIQFQVRYSFLIVPIFFLFLDLFSSLLFHNNLFYVFITLLYREIS